MIRLPDPATLNPVFSTIIQTYTSITYNSTNLQESPEDETLLKYDYSIDDLTIEVKQRFFGETIDNRYSDPSFFTSPDILVEYEQHKGRSDGWYYHCTADRILYIKYLFKLAPTTPFTTKVSDISEFVLYDISWQELRTLCSNNSYRSIYSGRTTGSLNWVVPITDIIDVKVFRYQHSLRQR